MDNLRSQLEEKTALSEQPEVYTDLAKSQQISKEIAFLANKVTAYSKAEKTVLEAEELVDLAELENDESILEELGIVFRSTTD